MDKIKVFVAGKINLSLNILGTSGGLHLLDSVMASVDLGDYVSVALRTDNTINIRFVDCEGIDPENNTVKKTALLLRDKIGAFGADIVVEKHIPVAAGMGGSSADIAGVLFALDKLLDLGRRGVDLAKVAKELGSDVPFMLCGGCAKVSGTGEVITPLQNNLRLFMVVAKGAGGVNSGQAYKRFDLLNPSLVSKPSDNGLLTSLLQKVDRLAIQQFDNALTPAAEELCGGIYSTMLLLKEAGAIKTVMTGSGSAVVGFFDSLSAAEGAAAALDKGLFARVCRFSDVGVRTVD